MADSVIELVTRRFLTDRVPGWSELTMTHASPSSPYCPDPWRFGESIIERMNEGGTFWVYVGHGHVQTLDYVKVDEQFLEIMTSAHIAKVDVGNRPPIAVFLACYTGAFDAREDCLAEQLLKHPTGPVAALAASRVTGPYGMSMLASGLLSGCYDRQMERLGDVVLHAKQAMLRPDSTSGKDARGNSAPQEAQMQLISSVASALSPEGHDLSVERLEHVWEMNLLGDPMLRISHPDILKLTVPERIHAGEEIRVSGVAPLAGRLQIEFALRRDALPAGMRPPSQFSSDDEHRKVRQKSYLAANDRILDSQSQVISAGEFGGTVRSPSELSPGRYCVRAFLEGDSAWAVGYATILVRAKQQVVK